MPSIDRLHHVMITVPSGAEDKARRFYCEVLGLPEVDKPDSLHHRGGLWLALAGQQVHIGVEDGVDRHATRAHLAFQVDDLGAWHERLAAQGVPLRESIPIPGYDRFECRDPFGNRLEFIQPVAPRGEDSGQLSTQ